MIEEDEKNGREFCYDFKSAHRFFFEFRSLQYGKGRGCEKFLTALEKEENKVV